MQPTRTFVCTCQHAHDRHAIKHTHIHTHHTQDISFHKSGNYTVNTAQITSMSGRIIFGVGKSTFALMRFHNFLRQKLRQMMFKLSDVTWAVGFCVSDVASDLAIYTCRHITTTTKHTHKKNPDAINDKRLKITPDHLSSPRKCNDDNEDEDALRY